MVIDLLLMDWEGMALEIMDLLLCLPSGMKAGFQIACGESGWIISTMPTGETNLTGHHQLTGTIGIAVEKVSPMKGGDLRGGHYPPLHLYYHHFLLNVVGGHVM